MPAVGPGSTDVTYALRSALAKVGRNVVLTRPVTASKATTDDAAEVVRVVSSVTRVKLPPATTSVPTCAKAFTVPSSTDGVAARGTAATTAVCRVCTPDAAGASPTSTARASSAVGRTRRGRAGTGTSWVRGDEHPG